jgi:hypothetical protein
MESSCASALPVSEPENIEAVRRRETNTSDPLAALEAAGRRETNAPFPKVTAESTGARKTNVPEERSAAVRRDGEPLTSAAKKQRQKEAAADRHQAAAGEQPSSSEGEDSRSMPLSAVDPKRKLHDTVSADRPQLTAARVGRAETSRGNSGLNYYTATRLRMETRCELARYLKAGTTCHISRCGGSSR